MDVLDAIFILSWLFRGRSVPACVRAANANGDAAVDLADAVYLLAHLFIGGPVPPALQPRCAPATLETEEALGCKSFPAYR